MTPAALRRRTIIGASLMMLGVIIGVTVATTTANGQTIVALALVMLGGYLWATAAMRGGR